VLALLLVAIGARAGRATSAGGSAATVGSVPIVAAGRLLSIIDSGRGVTVIEWRDVAATAD